MRRTQTPYALLHLQRVCSLSYLHLICISTLELGINCFVANDAGYNYVVLERQTAQVPELCLLEDTDQTRISA